MFLSQIDKRRDSWSQELWHAKETLLQSISLNIRSKEAAKLQKARLAVAERVRQKDSLQNELVNWSRLP